MSRTVRTTPLIAAIGVVVVLVVGLVAGVAAGRATADDTTAAAPGGSDGSLGGLGGAWRMTSLETGTPGALEQVPYSGEIVLDPAGRVSVQALDPDTTAPDTQFTVAGYEAWAGALTVDEDRGTFTARVDSSVARDMIGTEQVRRYEVTDDALVLTPAEGPVVFRATYARY